jgi:Outer membrane protein beta-barrel domain
VNRYLIHLVVLLVFFASRQDTLAQALPTATAPGAYIAVGGTYSVFQSNYGQRVLGGGGVFADINPRRQLGIEAEGRWLRQNALANTTESTYLIGPRVQFRRGPFSPYVKVLAGLGHFNFPYNDAHGSYFVIAPGAGVDFSVNNSLKIRLVDIEYQQWPQFTFGTISPYGVSFGLSYRVFNGSR